MRIDDQYGNSSFQEIRMKRERGFVVLPSLPVWRTGSRPALRPAVRLSRKALLPTLQRGRAFAIGLLIGVGFWAAIFAALN